MLYRIPVKLSCFLLACGLSLTAFSAVHAAPRVIEHTQGTVTLPEMPQRIAVFDLATLDTLMALEVDVAGVPQASWPDHLKQYAGSGYPKIGTLFEPDTAALKALNPDLIIIAGRSQAQFEPLSAIAPVIDLSIDAADFVSGVRRNLVLLGEIFDRSEQALALDTRLDGELDSLQAAGIQAGSALVLFTVNDNVMVQGPGERFGMIYDVAGMASAAPLADPQPSGQRPEAGSAEAAAVKQRQWERLAAALNNEPDWLLVLDRDAATGGGEGTGATTLAQNTAIVTSKAWRNKQVYYLDPPTWYVATGGYAGLLHSVQKMRQPLSGSE